MSEENRRIVFDIGHPAQVHHFKHTYWELEKRGWQPLFVAKDKEVALDLLDSYGFDYVVLGRNRSGILRKSLDVLNSIRSFYLIVKNFSPDIIISRFSLHSAFVAKLLGIPHIGFTDTEHVNLSDSVTVPLVDVKLTANSYQKELGNNHFRYPGNIELAYLHPNRFTPDPSVLDYLGVKREEKYVLMRFVSWEAHHDIGHAGLTYQNKLKAVKEFSKQAKVFISSEKELPQEFEQYKIHTPPEKMHDALYYANLYFGDGGTMTSEAAVLGTPAILVSSSTTGYLTEEESIYGLAFRFGSTREEQNEAIQLALDLMKRSNVESEWSDKRQKLLKDKIDVTKFMVDFIANFHSGGVKFE